MRWRKPQHFDRRTVRRFLLVPKAVSGDTRWLEWATIEEMYTIDMRGTSCWFPLRWVDEDTNDIQNGADPQRQAENDSQWSHLYPRTDKGCRS